MPVRSKKICLLDYDKLSKVNSETLKLYKKYEADMAIRELSKKSIAVYYNDLVNWWMYIYDYQDNRSVKEINEDDIIEFIYFCKQNGNNTERIKHRMASISAFYKFLRKRKLIVENPMDYVDRPKKGQAVVKQTFLTVEQVDTMRKVLKQKIEDSKNKSLRCQHDSIMLRVYAEFSLITMARVNAIANLRWEQIDFAECVANDVIEKLGKIVSLYFDGSTKEYLIELQNFRKENGINDNGWVFYSMASQTGNHLSTTALSDMCKEIGQMISVPTLHPHDFRHSGATLYKNAGMSLEEVSHCLHHESTEVTRKFYIKENDTELRAKKNQCHI